MKQYQKDIWESFKGVFSILFVTSVVLGGFITFTTGAYAGMAFAVSLFVPVLVTSIAVSVIAGIRVSS